MRELAADLGVSLRTVSRHAVADGWAEAREQFVKDTSTRSLQRATDQKVKENTRIYDITELLLDRIEELAEAAVGPASIGALTRALKDVRDIRGEKSKLDLEEQRARIEKLRHDVEADKPRTQRIEIVGLPEGYDV